LPFANFILDTTFTIELATLDPEDFPDYADREKL